MRIDTAVLLVVDVQNGFVTEEIRHILPVIIELVDRWQRLGGTTVYSRYFNYPGSVFERLMEWRQLYEPPDTDIVERLTPYTRHSTVFDKYGYSAVTAEFTELTHAHHWTDVAICGLDTDLCVLKTALDIFEHHLTSWVITNASASIGGDRHHDSALTVLGRAIGERHLVTVEELLRKF